MEWDGRMEGDEETRCIHLQSYPGAMDRGPQNLKGKASHIAPHFPLPRNPRFGAPPHVHITLKRPGVTPVYAYKETRYNGGGPDFRAGGGKGGERACHRVNAPITFEVDRFSNQSVQK